jgi:hypothetical protein
MFCSLLNFKIYVKANANYLPYSVVFFVRARIILNYISVLIARGVKMVNSLSQFFRIVIKDAEIKDNLIFDKSLLNLDLKYK